MSWPIALLILFATALAVSVCTPVIRRYAIRINAVQHGGTTHGRGARAHVGALPNVGGIAIFGGSIIVLVLAMWFVPSFSTATDFSQLFPIVLGGIVMWGIGLFDDLFELSALVRFGVQILVALYVSWAGIGIHFVTVLQTPGEYVFIPTWLGTIVTVLWIVGFTNAFNFIDGLDGLSSGVAVIGAVSLLTVSLGFPERGIAVLLFAIIAGAATGFLRHNASPASIIMGDSGAYFLGYLLSVVSIVGAVKVTAAISVFVPLVVLGLPVLNMTQVTLRRLRRGRNPGEASNDHLHDMLRERSGSRRFPVFVLWGTAMVLAFIGLLLASVGLGRALQSMVLIAALLFVPTWLRTVEARKQRNQL